MYPVIYDHPLIHVVLSVLTGGRTTQIHFNVKGGFGSSQMKDGRVIQMTGSLCV